MKSPKVRTPQINFRRRGTGMSGKMVGENFVYYLHGVTRWIGSGSSTRKVSHEWLVIPFERTIEQTTGTMPNANPKTPKQ